MQIIKQENLNTDEITEALKQGKVIVYPTETVYGLGCDATNQEAVDKIFKIKKRQQNKPVLMLATDPHMMMRYIDWTPKLQEIYDKYWPGPLTVVTPVKFGCNLPQGVLAGDNTIAFRITEHSLASELIKKLGQPLVSTSANITEQKSSYDIEDVLDVFKNEIDQPDIIIDSGKLPDHAPSTIIKIINNKIEILRQGELFIK